MKREELLNSKEYWLTKIQIDLFNEVEKYMEKHELNRTQLAEKLGVSKGYVSQILNGDADHRISKLVELSLAVGVVPNLLFENLESYIKKDSLDDAMDTYDEIEKSIKTLRLNGYLVSTQSVYPNAPGFFESGISLNDVMTDCFRDNQDDINKCA